MRIKSVFILFGLILATGCGERDDVSGDEVTPPLKTTLVSVMSFNALVTHSDDAGNQRWSVRGPACVAMILDVKPDIIGMQECRQEQYESLLSTLSEEYEGVNIPESKKNFGTCILYRKQRFSRYGSGYQWFSSTPDVPSPAFPDICDDPTYRTFIWADLRLEGTSKAVRIYSTHFPRKYTFDNAEARHRCAEAMVDHARKGCPDGMAVFMTGDMNCSLADQSGRYCLLPFTSWMKGARASLPDSQRDNWYSMNSFNDNAPLEGGEKSIDHIFFRGADPLEYRTVVEQFGGVRFLSDHYPVMAKMKISY